MKTNIKRITAWLLAFVLTLTLSACGGSVPELLDDGADRFAAGKKEDDYSLRNSGELLQSLIDGYSGAYQVPDSTQMDDDAFDDAKDKADEEDPKPPTATGGTILVGSWAEFLDALYGAYYRTEEYLAFEVTGSFSLDLNEDLQKSYTELQRRDPVYICCVKQWSWGNRGDEYVIHISYNLDIDEIDRMKAETESYVEAALEDLDAWGLSDYEIVCAVNEYLCDTVYYPASEPYAPETHTAYGALANGVAVCEGYACAAKLLLDELGVPCDIQVGFCTDGGGHAWNLVKLEGQWYQMDVTWNDGSLSRSDYLLVTDDYMRKSRSWDEDNYPVCASTPYEP